MVSHLEVRLPKKLPTPKNIGDALGGPQIQLWKEAFTALKWIHQVLGNLVHNCNIIQNYVEKYDLWLGILASAEFAIFSKINGLKVYIPGQFIFGRDMIIPIKHTMDWELTCKKN